MKYLIQAGYKYNEQVSIWIRQNFDGIQYSDGDEVEQRIASIIKNAADLSVLSDELRPHCIDWPSTYHLSATRANILRPFEQDLGGDILEIGAGCGAITRYLGECGGRVLALEGTQRRASITRDRTRDLNNVTVVNDKFDDFRCDRKFDAITLIGVLEYANLFTQGENAHELMLERVMSFLKPNGKLFIAIENQLGLKYFAGAPEDHIGTPLYGIEARYRKDQAQTFGRLELDRLLKKAGFSYSEFLAACPDYKLPISIITERGFNFDNFDAGALALQSVRKDPQLPPILAFSPELAWPTISSNGLGIELANSFLIVASRDKFIPLTPKKSLAWHFSTDRKKEYCKAVDFIALESGQVEVHSKYLAPSIEKYFSGTLIHHKLSLCDGYRTGKLMSYEIIRLISTENWQTVDVCHYLNLWLKFLFDIAHQREYPIGNLTSSIKLPGNFFDLLPHNIIISEKGNLNAIDCEWTYDLDLEVGFIVFRALNVIIHQISRFGRSKNKDIISFYDFIAVIMKDIGLPLTDENLLNWVELDCKIISEISGNYVDSAGVIHRLKNSYLQTLNLHQTLDQRNTQIDSLNHAVNERNTQIDSLYLSMNERNTQIDSLYLSMNERNTQIDSLYREMNERNTQITNLNQSIFALQNSISWRLTKPIRFIGYQFIRSQNFFKLISKTLRIGGGIYSTSKKALNLFQQDGISGLKRGFQYFRAVGKTDQFVESDRFDENDYSKWCENREPRPETYYDIMRVNEGWLQRPVISVVVPVYNTPADFLIAAIDSVLNQVYPYWKLCICDNASTKPHVSEILRRYVASDSRIHIISVSINGKISAASNEAISLVTTGYLTHLEHDDVLHPLALHYIAESIVRNDDADVWYSDEDKLDSNGERCMPLFKPDWSPHLALSQAYLGHLVCYRTAIVRDLGGYRTECDGSHDYDLWLRASLKARRIVHIPKVLYHCRMHTESSAETHNDKPQAHTAGLRALKEYVALRYPKAPVEVIYGAYSFTYQLKFSLPDILKVSIIIPTRNRVDLLRPCINSILEKSSWQNFEILILDNGSDDLETLSWMQEISRIDERVRVISANIEFNWSRLNNIGATQATGSVLVFLNNDTVVISPDWLEKLAGFALLPDVGIVGPLLLFEDSTIQHSGVVVGMGGWADHVYRTQTATHHSGPFISPVLTRNTLAVTGACAAISTDRFQLVGGFDEDFVVCGSDVEICLRAHSLGWYNVVIGEVRLFHFESKSRDPAKIPQIDFDLSALKYEPFRTKTVDPYFNPNLSLTTTTPMLQNSIIKYA
jgi:GT2 family glycosyltransferase/2-polyprenyl-3-methyl-5-hydroxy-6-metoxy-1,4-benzoquinol methylase